jgi:organic radical activating enzyme
MYLNTEGTVFEQFKELAAKLNEKPCDIAVYALSSTAKKLIPMLISRGFRVVAILDKNPDLSGQIFHGAKVYQPENYHDRDTPVIISTDWFLWGLVRNLNGMGFKNVLPYYFYIFDKNIELDNSIHYEVQSFQYALFCSTKKTNTLLSIDIPITMRCSLRCRDCANLMQYFKKPAHAGFDQLQKSIDRYFKAVDYTFDVRLLGGEPFVNPDCYKYIDLLLQYSSQFAYIFVFTNGTIIPNEKTLAVLKNPKVYVQISEYNVPSQKIERLSEIFDNHGIFYKVFAPQSWQDCARIQDYHRTDDELAFILKTCKVHNTPSIIDGKVFRCPLAGNAYLLSAMPADIYEYVELINTSDTNGELQKKIQSLMEQTRLKACNFCGYRDPSGITNIVAPGVQSEKPLEYKIYPASE